MSDERRREPRIDTLSLNLVVFNNLSGEILGTLANLSRNGLMVLSNAHSDPGGTLQIDLRDSPDADTHLLSMGIQVSWVSPANTPDSFWMGGRIIGITAEDTATLEALLRKAESEAAD
jgi:hypothetical protein